MMEALKLTDDTAIATFYQQLMNDPEPPHLDHYAFSQDIFGIVQELYNARVNMGVPEVKKCLARLSKDETKKEPYGKFVRIVNSATPQQRPAPVEPVSAPNLEVTKSEQLYPPVPEALFIPPEATQGRCPLKDQYVQFSMLKSPEGYKDFHTSCFWAMASTVAARRIVIKLATPQYTPLIVMLAARSTLYAKTVTAEVERTVLKAAGLDWMLGLTRMTPQKLLLDMSGPIPDNYGELGFDEQEMLKYRLAMSGQRGWHYNEFGKLIKSMMRSNSPMSDFVEVLLQISDCPEDIPGGTVGRGNERVLNPYLAVTGTLTPASIKAVAGKNAELWSDGFLSRIAFACPPPHTYEDKPFGREYQAVPNDLTRGIHAWHERLGIPEIDILPVLNEEGEKTGRYQKIWLKDLPETSYAMSDNAYQGWKNYRSALKAMTASFRNEDFDGSYGRLGTIALQVAALAASIGNASQIEYEHWQLGQEQAEIWRASLHQLYAQVNSNETPTLGPTLEDKVLEQVEKLSIKNPTSPPSARDIARALHMNTNKIEPILFSLVRNEELEAIRGRQSCKYKRSLKGNEE